MEVSMKKEDKKARKWRKILEKNLKKRKKSVKELAKEKRKTYYESGFSKLSIEYLEKLQEQILGKHGRTTNNLRRAVNGEWT